MEQENLLEVKNLTVLLSGKAVLKDITFDIEKGECLAIIGPSGKWQVNFNKSNFRELFFRR